MHVEIVLHPLPYRCEERGKSIHQVKDSVHPHCRDHNVIVSEQRLDWLEAEPHRAQLRTELLGTRSGLDNAGAAPEPDG
jgi:hypothetical protein